MVKISKIFGFSVSAGNALKWYPNGLKRPPNTFLWPVDPLLAHFGRFQLSEVAVKRSATQPSATSFTAHKSDLIILFVFKSFRGGYVGHSTR